MEFTVPEGYYYTKEHEWAKIEGNRAKIGISDFAQQHLGDVTYVDLPEIGKLIKQFEFLTGIESVKAASDLYSPLSGKVRSVNYALEKAPELVNKSCYGDGWIVEIDAGDPAETNNLMDAGSYQAYLAGLE